MLEDASSRKSLNTVSGKIRLDVNVAIKIPTSWGVFFSETTFCLKSQGFGNTPTTSKGWWYCLDSSSCSGVYSPRCVQISAQWKRSFVSQYCYEIGFGLSDNLKGCRGPQQLANHWRLLRETHAFWTQAHGSLTEKLQKMSSERVWSDLG